MPGWVPRNGFFGLKETIGTVHKRFYALASEQPSRKTVKPLDSRKTFLIDTYKHLMENSSMIFFVHYNNLSKTEDRSKMRPFSIFFFCAYAISLLD